MSVHDQEGPVMAQPAREWTDLRKSQPPQGDAPGVAGGSQQQGTVPAECNEASDLGRLGPYVFGTASPTAFDQHPEQASVPVGHPLLDQEFMSLEQREQYTGEDWFDDPPPEQASLLTREKDGLPVCYLPRSCVGMLAGQGGAGKTYGLLQLGLAVSAGVPWLGHYSVNDPGPVVQIFAEEPRDVLRRRLYHSRHAVKLNRQQLTEAKRNLVLLSGRGHNVELLNGDGGPCFLDMLVSRLEAEGRQLRLVTIDPLSRFASPDTELVPHAAGEFMRLLERLTQLPGGPTVIVAHHTTKSSWGGKAASADVRGSGALTTEIRWQAILGREDAEPRRLPDGRTFVWLEVTKTNYTEYPPGLLLVRDPAFKGALRPATEDEKRLYEADTAKGKNRSKGQQRRGKSNSKRGTKEPTGSDPAQSSGRTGPPKWSGVV